MTGSSTQGIKTMLRPVTDLARANQVYAALLGIPRETAAGATAPDPDGRVLGLLQDR